MKNLLKWISLPILCILLFSTSTTKVQAQDVSVSYQSFYDNLAPYGQWVYDPQYGNVFVPYEEPGFRPYSRGHWVMTEYGNTWVSNDPWGWACYHYGRWTYNGYYGWIWIPGNEWAPSWVSWRYGGGYVGWAPLGPGIAAGIEWECPVSWWFFVEPRYLYHQEWHNYYDGYGRNNYYLRRTEYLNQSAGRNYGNYNYGPRAEVIERETHTSVTVYRTNNMNTPGVNNVGGNTVTVYRPIVQQNTIQIAHPTNVIKAPEPIGNPQHFSPKQAQAEPAFRQQYPKPAQPPVRQNEPPVRQNEPPMHQPVPPIRNNEPSVRQVEPQMHQNEPPMHQPAPPVRPIEPPMHQNEPPIHQPEPPVRPLLPPVRQNEPPVRPMEPPIRQNEPPVRQNEPPMHQNAPQNIPQNIPQQHMQQSQPQHTEPNNGPRPNQGPKPVGRPQKKK